MNKLNYNAINIKLDAPKLCSCGFAHHEVKRAQICDSGHLWFHCDVCSIKGGKTTLMVPYFTNPFMRLKMAQLKIAQWYVKACAELGIEENI